MTTHQNFNHPQHKYSKTSKHGDDEIKFGYSFKEMLSVSKAQTPNYGDDEVSLQTTLHPNRDDSTLFCLWVFWPNFSWNRDMDPTGLAKMYMKKSNLLRAHIKKKELVVHVYQDSSKLKYN